METMSSYMFGPERPSRIKSRSQKSTLGSSGFIHTCTGMWISKSLVVCGIIVEGSERLYPFLQNLTERVILFKHHPIGRADYEELVTVNGTVAPTFPIRPGEPQFWQMGHIGADRF